MIEALRTHFAPMPVSMLIATVVFGIICVVVLVVDWLDQRRRRKNWQRLLVRLDEYKRGLTTKDPEV